jgi:hypothetical protein
MRVASAGSGAPAGIGRVKWPVLHTKAGGGATASCTVSVVQIDLDALPSDAAVLQQMLRTVLHQQGALHAENYKLRLLILRLTRQQFSRRSEQLSADQLQFGLEDNRQLLFGRPATLALSAGKNLNTDRTSAHTTDRMSALNRVDQIRHTVSMQPADHTPAPTSQMSPPRHLPIIDSQSVKSAGKGALHRSSRLRHWQGHQRQEAPSPGRHAGTGPARRG